MNVPAMPAPDLPAPPPRLFIDRTLRALAAILLMGLLVSVVAGVVSRQVGAPLSWTDELAQYLLVWTGFCGWLIASRKRSHIRITVIADLLPAAPGRGVEVVTQLAVIVLGAAIAWYSLALIGRNWDVESISLPVTAAFLYLPLPALGLALMAQAASEAWAALRGDVRVGAGQIL